MNEEKTQKSLRGRQVLAHAKDQELKVQNKTEENTKGKRNSAPFWMCVVGGQKNCIQKRIKSSEDQRKDGSASTRCLVLQSL